MCAFAAALAVVVFPAQAESSSVAHPELTSSFTARLIGGINTLVAAGPGVEGSQWNSDFLAIKEGTSDRVVLEFDLRGSLVTDSAVLSFPIYNLDAPNYNEISLYSFIGDGLAKAIDYYRTDSYITSFTDNGLAVGYFAEDVTIMSLDVTAAYNAAIASNQDYLAFLLKNTTNSARYNLLFNSYPWPEPTLSIAVPEPATLAYMVIAGVLVYERGVRSRIRRKSSANQLL